MGPFRYWIQLGKNVKICQSKRDRSLICVCSVAVEHSTRFELVSNEQRVTCIRILVGFIFLCPLATSFAPRLIYRLSQYLLYLATSKKLDGVTRVTGNRRDIIACIVGACASERSLVVWPDVPNGVMRNIDEYIQGATILIVNRKYRVKFFEKIYPLLRKITLNT